MTFAKATGYAPTFIPYITNNKHPIEFIILNLIISVMVREIAIKIEAAYPTISIISELNIFIPPLIFGYLNVISLLTLSKHNSFYNTKIMKADFSHSYYLMNHD